jgi:hypothetical protein
LVVVLNIKAVIFQAGVAASAAKSCPRGCEVADFAQPGWRGELFLGDQKNRTVTGSAIARKIARR